MKLLLLATAALVLVAWASCAGCRQERRRFPERESADWPLHV